MKISIHFSGYHSTVRKFAGVGCCCLEVLVFLVEDDDTEHSTLSEKSSGICV
jgi:hypothetical protein